MVGYSLRAPPKGLVSCVTNHVSNDLGAAVCMYISLKCCEAFEPFYHGAIIAGNVYANFS